MASFVLEDQVDGDLEAVLEGPGLLEAVLELELEDQVDELDDEKGRQELETVLEAVLELLETVLERPRRQPRAPARGRQPPHWARPGAVIVEGDRGDQVDGVERPRARPRGRPRDRPRAPRATRGSPRARPRALVWLCSSVSMGCRVVVCPRGRAGRPRGEYLCGPTGRCAGPGWGGPLCYRWVGGFGLLVCVGWGVLVGPCPGSLRQFRLIACQLSAVCVGWSCPPRPWGRRFSGTTRRPF